MQSIKKKEIIFSAIQKLNEKMMLGVIKEFISLLVETKVLKKIAGPKWIYKRPLTRFKSLEEKYN